MKFAVKLLMFAVFFSGAALYAADDNNFDYEEAANAGDSKAQYNYGLCFLTGNDRVVKNEKTAFEWFKKSADQGYPHAECMVGLCYAFGKGVNHDDKKALEYFQKAADKDIPEADFNIGWFYERGRGGFKADEDKAMEYYNKAAAREHEGAKAAIQRIRDARLQKEKERQEREAQEQQRKLEEQF